MMTRAVVAAGLTIAALVTSTNASAQDWGPPPPPPPYGFAPPPPPPPPPPPRFYGEDYRSPYGYGYAYGYRYRPHCWTEYRHHGWERVRICR